MSKKDKKEELMWVHPRFKREIKSAAALKGMSVLQFTEEMCLDEFDILNKDNGKKKRRNPFELNF